MYARENTAQDSCGVAIVSLKKSTSEFNDHYQPKGGVDYQANWSTLYQFVILGCFKGRLLRIERYDFQWLVATLGGGEGPKKRLQWNLLTI